MANPRSLSQAARSSEYDLFARGAFPVGVRTIPAVDAERRRTFPCEVWYPAAARHAGEDANPAMQDWFVDPPSGKRRSQEAIRNAAEERGMYPLVLFSHSSAGRRRQSTFLCTHLGSHGYIVAALDHSETIVPELFRPENETAEHRAERIQGWVANRVPDVRFLLDRMLDGATWSSKAKPDPARIGIVGHSFGGWTALATPEAERRIRAVVALAPAGMSNPPPNIIPVKLTFEWGRDVPTLYLVAENDTALPLAGMHELFERTRSTKHMVVLRHAGHEHFVDELEPGPGQCPKAAAHLFVRGLTLCHLDATLKQDDGARRFMHGDIETDLAERGVEAKVHGSDNDPKEIGKKTRC